MPSPRFNDYRTHVTALYEAALDAVDPYLCVQRELLLSVEQDQLTIGPDTIPLNRGRIWLIAAGKAALPMARAAADQLGNHLHQGVVIYKNSAAVAADFSATYPQLKLFPAAHPVSDESGVTGTLAARELLSQTEAEDIVLCLISGGSSALFTAPLLPLAEWQQLNEALLASGCSIHEFNRIRQQLDAVKGGGLLRWAAPASVYGLILSDVIGDNLSIIGSGPTVEPAGTPTAADALLEALGVYARLTPTLVSQIKTILTSTENQPTEPLPQPHNHLVANLKIAAEAALQAANQLGFKGQCLTTRLEGDAQQMGRFAAALAVDAQPGQALILGGEATVIVRGKGRGGRNQELALAAVPHLDESIPVVLAALATDGEDRLTGVAGAIATHLTSTKLLPLALDVSATLADNDSYTFWHKLAQANDPLVGGLVEREPTGTNVNDLIIILRYEA